MNCRNKFNPIPGCGKFHDRARKELIPGRGRFHVRAGREQELPSGQNRCIDGSNPGDRIRTLSARNDRRHAEGEAGTIARRKGMMETFSKGVSLEEASVSIG